MSEHGEQPIPDLIHLPDTRRALWLRLVLGLGALLSFVLWIVLVITPVLTGVPFLILGCALLSTASPRVGRAINAWERRLPRRYRLWLRPKLRRAEARGSGERSGTKQ